LKDNYNEIIKNWQDLSLSLIGNPTDSVEVNQAFNDFLSCITELKKQMSISSEEHLAINIDDIIEQDEQLLEESKETLQFVQVFQNN